METDKVIMECDTKFSWRNLKALARVMGEEWSLAQDTNGKAGLWLYTFHIARSAHYTYTLWVNGKAVGFAALTVCSRRRHLIYTLVYFFIKYFLLKNKKAYKDYCAVYDNSTNKWTDKYDTEGDIIIVDKQYRGRGYGKWLMESLLSTAKLCGKTMKIETYSDCAWGFHEKFDVKKVFEDRLVSIGSCNVDSEVCLGYVKQF